MIFSDTEAQALLFSEKCKETNYFLWAPAYLSGDWILNIPWSLNFSTLLFFPPSRNQGFKGEIISVGPQKHDRDEKSQERKEKDKKSIRLKKISLLKRQISQKEKQLEVKFSSRKT